MLPISSLRFVLAVWVVLGHYGLPFLESPQRTRFLWSLRAFRNLAFEGSAAVIVFFVISGFCIHFPHRKTLKLSSWRAFYLRRYVRILIPMAVAIGLSIPLGMKFGLFTQSILWSLLCEEIYYLLYPLVLRLRGRLGWPIVMSIGWVISLATILTNPSARYYPSYGPYLNWAVGWPCWLLGCWLAERQENDQFLPVSTLQIWGWRSAAYLLSLVTGALSFHTPLGLPWTLNAFAVFATFWLEREMRYYRMKARTPWFESPGEASYSIYLTHTHGPVLLSTLVVADKVTPGTYWFEAIILCFVFSVTFYWLVERPCHALARRVAKSVERFGSIAAAHPPSPRSPRLRKPL
ncbi:MAG: acyltransferase [Acidobacteriaceae bacterium]|nr:acyltransferase [Acidobacteriaceae bacterium]